MRHDRKDKRTEKRGRYNAKLQYVIRSTSWQRWKSLVRISTMVSLPPQSRYSWHLCTTHQIDICPKAYIFPIEVVKCRRKLCIAWYLNRQLGDGRCAMWKRLSDGAKTFEIYASCGCVQNFSRDNRHYVIVNIWPIYAFRKVGFVVTHAKVASKGRRSNGAN